MGEWGSGGVGEWKATATALKGRGVGRAPALRSGSGCTRRRQRYNRCQRRRARSAKEHDTAVLLCSAFSALRARIPHANCTGPPGSRGTLTPRPPLPYTTCQHPPVPAPYGRGGEPNPAAHLAVTRGRTPPPTHQTVIPRERLTALARAQSSARDRGIFSASARVQPLRAQLAHARPHAKRTAFRQPLVRAPLPRPNRS